MDDDKSRAGFLLFPESANVSFLFAGIDGFANNSSFSFFFYMPHKHKKKQAVAERHSIVRADEPQHDEADHGKKHT